MPEMFCQSRFFGELDDQPVTHYTLRNPNGMSISVINYGATLVSVCVPN